MRSDYFNLSEFFDTLELAPNAVRDSFPVCEIAFDYAVHDAEPDVGIFDKQLELRRTLYLVDGDSVVDEHALATTIYDKIGNAVTTELSEFVVLLRECIDKFEELLYAD